MPQSIVVRVLLAGLLTLPFAAAARDLPTPTVGVTTPVDVVIPDKPIATRAQLDAYLRDTPAAKSPLNWMTAAGRQRFLASIIFGEHGVGGFNTEDLSFDLTRSQAYTLLRLFGAENYAINLDARTTPRPHPANVSASVLEKSYDEFVVVAGTGDHPAMVNRYTTDFAPYQTDAQRHALGDADMDLLFRVTSRVADITSDPRHLKELRADFAELERRHLVERPQLAYFHDSLLLAHQTDEAQALLASHPQLDPSPMPSMRLGSRIHKGQPSLWVPSQNRRELVRFRFNIRVPSQVIVLSSTTCHFCVNAARALEADPMLRDIFRDYAQWVTSSDEITAFDAVRNWNRTYTEMRLGINYDDRELPMVKQFVTPTFFFLDHGTVVDTVTGWPDAGNLEAIRNGLRKIDLMR